MKATLREEFLNIPNMLTLARIAGIPLVVFFIWRGDPRDCVLAAWLYSVVSVTDYIDGWLARRWNMVTVMGKFLDPLADKLMVMAMLIMLVALNRVPASLVVVLLAREMTINGLRAIASSEGLVIPAGEMGKYKTALQMIGRDRSTGSRHQGGTGRPQTLKSRVSPLRGLSCRLSSKHGNSW